MDVPPDATPTYCPYCGYAAPDERTVALHEALAHYDALSEAERETARAAYESETADLRRFRLKALGALVLLYFGFLFVYALIG